MIDIIKRGLRCLRENGIFYTLGRISVWWKKRRAYGAMEKSVFPTNEELSAQRQIRFDREIKISILTPLYNTPLDFLREMIKSVQDQTYANWELCLCDGSDAEHADVGQICREYAKHDSRIRYQQMEKNEGISENTNACIDLASGDYFALLDHDDVLHPCALFRVMEAICSQDADLIYTDEAKFAADTRRFYDPNFKPDFSKDELRAHNYICHLTVYSRQLLEQVGKYRSECDGSQDHDMVLRLSEKAKHIVHIPQILYFWRVHKGSVAAGITVKEYAVAAAHRAVKDQLVRTGELGKIKNVGSYPSLYRVDYDLWKTPKISVIIYGATKEPELWRCVDNVEEQTFYYPMEICILEGAVPKKEFDIFLKRIPCVKPVRVISKEDQADGESIFDAAIQQCEGEYIVFIHAFTALYSKDWAEEMLMYAQREDIGAVGAHILDCNSATYSGGLALDPAKKDLVHIMHQGVRGDGYEAALRHVRNVTAVSGRCLMISKEKLSKAGGLRGGLGDYTFIDLCLRLREQGFLNVWDPFVWMLCWQQLSLTGKEQESFQALWKKKLPERDPYYNPNVRDYLIY